MSLQGPIVVVAEKPDGRLVEALTAAGAFPVIETSWSAAADAIRSIKPCALVIADRAPDPDFALALDRQIAESEPYLPAISLVAEEQAPSIQNALPVMADAPAERLFARLTSAMRLRSLHATAIGRAATLKAERNILAEIPAADPLDDATVLVVGRGRAHPTLSVAVGERMGVMGALSIDFAAQCLNAREIDGIVIGDGLSPRMVVAMLVVLGEDVRFRELPVALLGAEERIDELPNLIHARDPRVLVDRLVPMVRARSLEARLKRLLKSIEAKGMIDARTGLLRTEAFGNDLARAIEDAAERGIGLSVARFSFEEALDLRASLDAARLMSRRMRDVDFACRQDDGSIVAAFTATDLRAAHVVARRLASVLKHTMLRPTREQTKITATVTIATFKPGDTPLSLMARVASQTVAAE